MADIDLNIRVCFLETFESFRSRDDAHEFDLFSAMLLDEIYGSNCRTTGCEHRVKSYDQSLVDGIREFAVIFMWLVGYMSPALKIGTMASFLPAIIGV